MSLRYRGDKLMTCFVSHFNFHSTILSYQSTNVDGKRTAWCCCSPPVRCHTLTALLFSISPFYVVCQQHIPIFFSSFMFSFCSSLHLVGSLTGWKCLLLSLFAWYDIEETHVGFKYNTTYINSLHFMFRHLLNGIKLCSTFYLVQRKMRVICFILALPMFASTSVKLNDSRTILTLLLFLFFDLVSLPLLVFKRILKLWMRWCFRRRFSEGRFLKYIASCFSSALEVTLVTSACRCIPGLSMHHRLRLGGGTTGTR